MKKRLLIPVFILLLGSVNAQAKLHNSLSKYFKKNKVSNLNDYLISLGGVKTSNKTLPDFLNNTPSLAYDVWELEEFMERYYIFRSYEDETKYKQQINFLYNNILDKSKTVYTVKQHNYYGYVQEIGGYEILMVVIKH